MNTVDGFIRNQILNYPLLYPNRTAVLEHVFCVIGNGYMWGADGTIVRNDDYEPEPWDKEDQLVRIEEDLEAYSEELRELLRPGMMAGYLAELETVENVDERIKLTPAIVNIYPQSNYALLMNVPENVSPEWQAVANEARELAVAAGWKFSV